MADGEFPGVFRQRVGDLEYTWNLEEGTSNMGGFAVTTLFRDSSLASLLQGVEAMVGPERFLLALQTEGQKGVEQDWQVVTSQPTFEEGFALLSKYAAGAGWGRWVCEKLDREQKEAVFAVKNSWEGELQKALGVCWGSGLISGKFAAFGRKLFGENCWAEQTKHIAKGDDRDEFVVRPSARSLDGELASLLESDAATRADYALALRDLREVTREREQVLSELQSKMHLIQTQNEAIKAMAAPIIQVWEGILAAPVIGYVDSERIALMTEKLLDAIVRTQARWVILDVTGVDVIDTMAANGFVQVLHAARLLGTRGVITGMSPRTATAIVGLGVNLSDIATYTSMQQALRVAIDESRRESRQQATREL